MIASRLAVLALTTATLAGLLATACGGDATVVAPTPTTTTGTAGAGPPPASASKAQGSVPDLSALGYTVQQQGKDPGAVSQDVYRVLFARENGRGAMTVLYAFPDDATAKSQFAILSAALKNPPPDFVGAKATFIDTGSPPAGDERKAYVTQALDGQGNKVWSDVYRFGRLVAIVQVLDDGKSEQLDLRLQIALKIAAKAR